MAVTYESLATTTLTSTSATITFSSISGSYTDLRIVLSALADTTDEVYLRFNSDNATNYSRTLLTGDGTNASSSRATGANGFYISFITLDTSKTNSFVVDIFSYSGSTFKTCFATASQDENGSGAVALISGMWRSTAAITDITINPSAVNFTAGTTATLYGITKA